MREKEITFEEAVKEVQEIFKQTEKKITITYNNGKVSLEVTNGLNKKDVIGIMEECIKKIKEF